LGVEKGELEKEDEGEEGRGVWAMRGQKSLTDVKIY
jgi:hypothetical protein